MEKKFRIQLTELELKILRNLLAETYRCDKSNVRYEEMRIKAGAEDSRVYPVAEQRQHLKFTRHLLKKLSKPLNTKWLEW